MASRLARHPRRRRAYRAFGAIPGANGTPRDVPNPGIFKGIDSTPLYAAPAVVIVLLLLTYRSPPLSAADQGTGRRRRGQQPGRLSQVP